MNKIVIYSGQVIFCLVYCQDLLKVAFSEDRKLVANCGLMLISLLLLYPLADVVTLGCVYRLLELGKGT